MSAIDIDALVDDLTPVKSLRERDAMSYVFLVTGFLATATFVFLGCRNDLLMGMPHPMFFLRGGTLLILGFATAYAAVTMSKPSVGQVSKSWMWALAGASLFPLTAIFMALMSKPNSLSVIAPMYGKECMQFSIMGGLAVGSLLVYWLRRGAPTSPNRAGWLVGIASGSLGAAAYSLHCPFNGILYVGTWYTLAVASCAIIGRLVVPRLIRW